MIRDNDSDDWLTVMEAAALKGVHPHSVRRAIDNARLAAIRKGRIWLLRRSDLDAWQVVGHRPSRRSSSEPGVGKMGRKAAEGLAVTVGASRPNEGVPQPPGNSDRSMRAEILAFLEADHEEREGILKGAVRPELASALRKALQLKSAVAGLADLRISTEQYFREKREEIAREMKRAED